MITVDFYRFFRILGAVSAACDLALAARLILTVSPLFTGFTIALRLFAAGKVKVRPWFPLTYLLVSLVYFLFAAADALFLSVTFDSVVTAAIVSAATFAAQFFIYLCLVAATRVDEKPKKRYVARFSESPIPREKERSFKAYPLKSNIMSRNTFAARVDYEEFLKFLKSIGNEGLSFSDEEEYNKIKNESRFLSGVEVTEETAKDFRSLFMRAIKLAARYGVE